MNFNYEIINEEFINDKIWIVIFKFLTLTTLKTMVEFDLIKFFDLANKKFEPNFQIKSSFSKMT